MTAPAISLNVAPAPGAAGAGVGGPHVRVKAPGDALEDFEAVFASLFGAAPDPAAAGAGPPGAKKAKAADVVAVAVTPGAETPDGDQADPEATDPAAEPTTADAALLLAGATPVAPTATAAPPIDGDAAAADAPTDGKATAPAFGRDKPRGTPAAPALANANLHARLAEKAGLTSDEETPDSVEAEPNADAPGQAQKLAKAAAPPPQPVTPPRGGEPLGPPEAKPQAKADIAPDAPVVEAAVVASDEAKQAVTLPDTASPVATAALAGRPAAPPPAQPQRGAPSLKAERTREAIDAPMASKTAAASHKADDAVGQTPVPAAAAADKEAADASAGASDAPDHGSAQADAPIQTTTALSPETAHTPVRGAPETVAKLAAQIVKRLENRSTRFDLELHPAGLGKVDVRLEIGAAGQISAAMTFDNPQAAADLKARASELQRALEQAGFNLSGGLSFDVAGDRGQTQHGWQQAEDHGGHGFRGRAFQDALNTAGDAVDQAVSGALRLRRGISSALDVRI